MHPDELTITVPLVKELIASQFPHWADLLITPVPSAGTDNSLFRLGDNMVVRLPRIHWAIEQVKKEQQWLPRLSPFLPLAVPLPLGKGVPSANYPWHWSVYSWVVGENATIERIADPQQAAFTLAGFIRTLQGLDTTGAPVPGTHNFGRGVPLAERDDNTRLAIASLGDRVDAKAATSVWESGLAAPVWDKPPVWIHGDLQAGNLLVRKGELVAVVDFGGLGIGDPACDLIVAWNLFPPDTHASFRVVLEVDDATWKRGRAWALSVALIALPYYWDTNPALAAASRYTIAQVLADWKYHTK